MKIESQRKLNLIYGDPEALDRNFGQRGDIYYDHQSGTLRVYNGTVQGGIKLVKSDLSNVNTTANLTVNSVTANLIGNVTGNTTGIHTGAVIGNITGNVTGNLVGDVKATNGTTVLDSGNTGIDATFVGNVTGNVTGTVSSLSNHTTTNLAEGTNQYFTQARARQSLSQGTGVTYDSTSGAISIGQAVSTTSNVTFNDLIVSGNLTVNGTTTTLNTATLDVEDLNITVAKGAANAAAANGAGLTVDGAGASIIYESTLDSWSLNKSVGLVGLTNTGTTNVQQITEVVTPVTSLVTTSSTVDFTNSEVFYYNNLGGNFTLNVTNVPTTNNRVITIAVIISQGATGYIPNALNINGSGISINWLNGSAPSGNANKIDFVTFTLLRVTGTWIASGALSRFG